MVRHMTRKKLNKPMFRNMKYCTRCCMPESQEGTVFDEMGICRACQSSEQKIHINWVEREKKLRSIFEEAKRKAGDNYDCIIPISGGKDSMFQMHVLKEVYDMKPLAVTCNHNWYSKTGWYNLFNFLEKFNVDHIMFTPNRGLVNRLAKKSLSEIGDVCWHCHAGPPAFVLNIAVKYNIPLLVWGESIADGSGKASYMNPVKFNREYFLKVSGKVGSEKMIGDEISKRDLFPFTLPTPEEYDKAEINGIHLGDYIFWDEERQVEFIRDTYGWRETEMEGTYKGYKSAECIMSGMHDFTCYLKRGFGRATWQACQDVRQGLLTREEGFELINTNDPVRPEALDYYLKITGMSEDEFFRIMKEKRVPQLKDEEVPVLKKRHRNRERILPFAEQLLEELGSKNRPNEHKPKANKKS
jgi:N-acetyl sugar amidotransferase